MLTAGRYSKDFTDSIAMTNPKVKEPLSPMKMEAGFQLKIKKAKRVEINAIESHIMKKSSFVYPTVK